MLFCICKNLLNFDIRQSLKIFESHECLANFCCRRLLMYICIFPTHTKPNCYLWFNYVERALVTMHNLAWSAIEKILYISSDCLRWLCSRTTNDGFLIVLSTQIPPYSWVKPCYGFHALLNVAKRWDRRLRRITSRSCLLDKYIVSFKPGSRGCNFKFLTFPWTTICIMAYRGTHIYETSVKIQEKCSVLYTISESTSSL